MALNFTLNCASKSYGHKIIIEKCSYTFEYKAVYVILGGNGVGKSTLLRLCALLEQPDSGKIIYSDGGNRLNKDIVLQRRLTIVLPSIGVFNTSVRDNVAYGLRIRGDGKKRTEFMVGEALDFVGLKDRYEQNALSLSSGEKQRLGIARAIAIKPEILFLDEPTASVDKDNSEIIDRIILDLKANYGTKIIMTTHDFKQADKLADFKLLLENGLIQTL